MGARFGVTFELAAVGSGYKSAGIIIGSTSKRLRMYDLLVGQGGTPADNAVYWDVARQTAAGTATSVTPQALDPADSATTATAASNATLEGTVTAGSDVITVAINQRASYRWVAAPGGELIVPATAAAGFAIRTKSAAYTGVGGGTVHFEE